MRIWLINNYVTLPRHGQFTRQYSFGKCLKDMGHKPVVFAGSHPHNSRAQLIKDGRRFAPDDEAPFPWLLVKTLAYGKSRKKQVLSMFQFYLNGKKAAKYALERYGRPDAVLGSSAHPLAALLAVRLAKKYGCRSVVEIRDLWPESIVVYGIAGPCNPAVIALRRLEKWLYKNADAVVFTMEGGYDYIVEQGWEKEIPRSKVYYINNGVDLEAYQYNREHFQVEDPDLDDPDTFKVVYAGSIRTANGMDQLVDCAALLRDEPRVKFLIYGDGPDLEALRERVRREGLSNVALKGRLDKKYIPYVLSKSSLNVLNYSPKAVAGYRFGSSQNKLFEYLASGKPILSNVRIGYSIVDRERCGLSLERADAEAYAEAVLKLSRLPEEEYWELCENARRTAREYDFKKLTRKLVDVMEGIRKL